MSNAKSRRGLGIAIGAVLVICAIAGCVLVAIYGQLIDARMVVVHDGDGETHQLPLAQDAQLEVQTSYGTNVVQVSDGSVCIIEADCPNGDCIDQGTISDAGQQIICLPHHLWVEVVDTGSSEAGGAQQSDEATDSSHFDAVGR